MERILTKIGLNLSYSQYSKVLLLVIIEFIIAVCYGQIIEQIKRLWHELAKKGRQGKIVVFLKRIYDCLFGGKTRNRVIMRLIIIFILFDAAFVLTLVKLGDDKGLAVGDSVTFGRYQQEKTDKGEYQISGINWTVLAVENGQALLLSDMGLRYEPILSEDDGWASWSDCHYKREFCKDFYFEAFTLNEQEAIVEINEQIGKVFCLSENEVERFFPVSSERICIPSDYAVDDCNDNPPSKGGQQPKAREGGDHWWLRDHGSDQGSFMTVNYNGDIRTAGTQGKYAGIMFRPAIWVYANKVKANS